MIMNVFCSASGFPRLLYLFIVLLMPLWTGCQHPTAHRAKADKHAEEKISRVSEELFGRRDELDIVPPRDALRRILLTEQQLQNVGPESVGLDQLEPVPLWPEPPQAAEDTGDVGERYAEGLELNLLQSLAVGAMNNREYQTRKEDIYRAALSLDLEEFQFQNTFQGAFESVITEDRSDDENTRGVVNSLSLGAGRVLTTGAELSARLSLDLVKLLTLDRDSAYGILADVTVAIPLLRGSRRAIVMEPLTQAERNLMYAMYSFEHFKRSFAVRVANDYYSVLQQLDQVRNAEENYRRLELSSQRSRRLADAGRLPEIQVDQGTQEELRARDRWLNAQASYERSLDQFKVSLGLPGDAHIQLDDKDMQALKDLYPALPERVASQSESALIDTALTRRMDMQVAVGRVYDAQRAVVVAADALRWDARLTGTGRAGEQRSLASASQGDATFRPDDGVYSAGLEVDAPWSRRAERNAYRDSFIQLERQIRDVAELEDQIKLDVRDRLRTLKLALDSIEIQENAVVLSRRRVDSTEQFLQAGRAQIRDVLEAQEAFISAQNSLTAARVSFRVAWLELQRDLGILEINEQGILTDMP
jgi:outer membrane protein TolC